MIQQIVSPLGIEAWLVEDYAVPLVAVDFAFRGGASQDAPGRAGIGQLMVVAFVASTLAAVARHSQVAGRRVAFAGSLAVIGAGAFWFVQRVLFPGGNL